MDTPNNVSGIVLSALEFRDELRDRYSLKILDISSYCDGCTSKFSTSHALVCKVGGLVHSCHNDSR